MNKLKELRAKKEALVADMDKLIAKDVMDEKEKAEFDAKKIEVDAVNKDIERAESLIKMKNELETKPVEPSGRKAEPTSPTAEIIVNLPAQVKKWGNMKSFKGAEASENAYKAGMWYLAIGGNEKGKRFCSEHGMPLRYEAAHSEGSNIYGGYLVPDVLDNAIIDLKVQYGAFRRNTRVRPMSSDILMIPRRSGGLTGYWVGEATAGTEATKTWNRVALSAKKLMVLTRYSSELSEDAIINIADDLTNEIAYTQAYSEDQAGFNGDGTSTYGGITGVITKIINQCSSTGISSGTFATNSGVVRYGTGYAWSNIAITNLTDVMGRLPSYARVGAKWYTTPSFFYGVMTRLLVAAGGVTMNEMANGVAGPSFMGYPVEFAEAISSTQATNTIPVLYGNLAMASSLGDRRQNTISFSNTAYVGSTSVFETDEIAVKATSRLDIVVHDVGTTSTAGPVVALISHTA